MQREIKILIVDDHALFREGVKYVIAAIDGFSCIGEASNGKECIEFLKEEIPDIILMDISMPQMDGIKTTKVITDTYPLIKILVVSGYGEDAYYNTMINSGANGFISKNTPKDEIEKALRSIADGSTYFPSSFLNAMIKNNLAKKDKKAESGFAFKITKREKEILSLICHGYSNVEIAKELCISPKTVDNHRTNLLSKTQVRNSASLVMFAIKNNIIDII